MENNQSLILLLAEAVVVLTGVLGTWAFVMFRRRRSDLTAAQVLIDRVRSDEPTYLIQTLDAYLEAGGDPANIERLAEEEQILYRHLIETYVNRNAKALVAIPDHLTTLLSTYAELLSFNRQGGGSSPEQAEEIELLRQSHAELEEQLQTALGAIQKMLQERSESTGHHSQALEVATVDQLLEALAMITGQQEPLSEGAQEVAELFAGGGHDQEAWDNAQLQGDSNFDILRLEEVNRGEEERPGDPEHLRTIVNDAEQNWHKGSQGH